MLLFYAVKHKNPVNHHVSRLAVSYNSPSKFVINNTKSITSMKSVRVLSFIVARFN